MNLVDFLKAYGVLIALVAGGMWLLLGQFFTKRRAAKEFGYQVLSRELLLSPKATALDKVRLQVGDKTVHNASVVRMLVVNPGNVAVKKADFEEPFCILAPEGAEFLDAEVVSTSSRDFKPVLTVTPGKVELVPILVNAGASFTVTILASGLYQDPAASGYIEGVPEIRNVVTRVGRFYRSMSVIAWRMQVANLCLYLLVAWANSWKIPFPWVAPVSLSMTVIFVLLSIWGMVRTVMQARQVRRESQEKQMITEREYRERQEQWERERQESKRVRDEERKAHEEEMALIIKEQEQRLAQINAARQKSAEEQKLQLPPSD